MPDSAVLVALTISISMSTDASRAIDTSEEDLSRLPGPCRRRTLPRTWTAAEVAEFFVSSGIGDASLGDAVKLILDNDVDGKTVAQLDLNHDLGLSAVAATKFNGLLHECQLVSEHARLRTQGNFMAKIIFPRAGYEYGGTGRRYEHGSNRVKYAAQADFETQIQISLPDSFEGTASWRLMFDWSTKLMDSCFHSHGCLRSAADCPEHRPCNFTMYNKIGECGTQPEDNSCGNWHRLSLLVETTGPRNSTIFLAQE